MPVVLFIFPYDASDFRYSTVLIGRLVAAGGSTLKLFELEKEF